MQGLTNNPVNSPVNVTSTPPTSPVPSTGFLQFSDGSSHTASVNTQTEPRLPLSTHESDLSENSDRVRQVTHTDAEPVTSQGSVDGDSQIRTPAMRCLFGRPDPEETRRFLDNEEAKINDRLREKYKHCQVYEYQDFGKPPVKLPKESKVTISDILFPKENSPREDGGAVSERKRKNSHPNDQSSNAAGAEVTRFSEQPAGKMVKPTPVKKEAQAGSSTNIQNDSSTKQDPSESSNKRQKIEEPD
ncbi:cyclin-dependent kinase inhibitor [Endozoicomonas sp.]|uniref:cyclin-dependent kinase inhibitor n=1 Tax=Endozoicomonas sp. TaxID=1892382 RepID=UPI003AF9161B